MSRTCLLTEHHKGSGERGKIKLLNAGTKTDQSQAQTSDNISREKKKTLKTKQESIQTENAKTKEQDEKFPA